MNILIIDGDVEMRQSLSQVLSKHYADANITELASGEKLITTVSSRSWNIIIAELAIPGLTASEIIHRIKQYASGAPLLIFSKYPVEQYAIPSIQTGASSYLGKSGTTMDEIIRAIEYIQTGKRYLTNEVADLLIRFVRAKKSLRKQH